MKSKDEMSSEDMTGNDAESLNSKEEEYVPTYEMVQQVIHRISDNQWRLIKSMLWRVGIDYKVAGVTWKAFIIIYYKKRKNFESDYTIQCWLNLMFLYVQEVMTLFIK